MMPLWNANSVCGAFRGRNHSTEAAPSWPGLRSIGVRRTAGVHRSQCFEGNSVYVALTRKRYDLGPIFGRDFSSRPPVGNGRGCDVQAIRNNRSPVHLWTRESVNQ